MSSPLIADFCDRFQDEQGLAPVFDEDSSAAPRDHTDELGDVATRVMEHFIGSASMTLNEIVRVCTAEYVDALDPADPPEAAEAEKFLLGLVNSMIDMRNEKHGKRPGRLSPLTVLHPVQVAMIVGRLHRIAEVTPGGVDQDDGLGVLAVYQDAGEFTGLYRRADLGLLDELARKYNPTNDTKWFNEFERAVHGFAPKVSETFDPDLVVMKNLIYNYRTDERIPFSPDYVFLARNSDIDLIEQQHPVPEVHDADGNIIWNYEQWWDETVPDEGTRVFTHKVIGAAFRPGHDWQKMPAFYSESGSNGKGTILAHIRACIGARNCASLPLNLYSSRFGKEQTIGKRLNAPDETAVGDFIKDASDLKSIITNDPIYIDRKNKPGITYKPRMLTIVTLNGALNFRDKTEPMNRRLAIVPMTQRFTGGAKNKAIKDDYLLRREVCEYMA